MRFPSITHFKYCQKLDFEADSKQQMKDTNNENMFFFDFKINEISFYNAIQIWPKIGV